MRLRPTGGSPGRRTRRTGGRRSAITPAAETALASLRDAYEALAHDLLGDVPPADLARCWSVLTTVQDRLGDVVARRDGRHFIHRVGPLALPQLTG